MNKVSGHSKNELPEGWSYKSLADIADKISLNKIKIKQKDYLPRGEYPVVDQGKELIGGYFDNQDLLVPSEPPYIIFGDHTKVKKFITFKFVPGADGVKVLKAKEGTNPKYLFYLLHTIKIDDKGYARHFQFLEKSHFAIAPSNEQQQIVSKIEELFSELDKSIEQLKKAQQQLKFYRQSVLKWAFEGKLTNENVKDGELPWGWQAAKLGEILEVLTDYHANGSYVKLKENVVLMDQPNHAIMIRATNFEKDDFTNNLKYISESAYDFLNKSKLYGGEILIGKIGNAGKVYFMPKLNRPASLAMNLFALRFNKDVISKYIYYHLLSDSSDAQIKSLVKGVGNPTIDKKAIRSLDVMLPSKEEQKLVIQEIESRLSVADKLEETITNSLQQAEALRQSILKKAFEGKL